jgi:hypothetical protein
MSEPVPGPIAAALAAPRPAPQLAQAGDPGPELGGGRYERPPFPPGCPVKPLGIAAGIDGSQKCFYLDVNGQLVGLEAGNRHGKNSLIALFGARSDWLEANFPQWSAPKYEGRGASRVLVSPSEIVGFDQAEASRALIEESVRRGIFDPTGKMRGRGAHPLPLGGVVIHHGDKLLISRQRVSGEVYDFAWQDVGLFERHVYPAAEPIPRPWHESVPPTAANTLLKLLRSWRWKRERIDPQFMLGWIGAAMLGGALEWRPNIWLTGGKGTGKSTLNGRDKLLHQLFGDGVFRTGNASAAAIRQSLKNATVPVLFDEIEASEDNRRVDEVIALARVASSGDVMHRGGQDHQAHEFTIRSCFQFSSINIPPLQPQDRSRLAILELKPFEPGDKAPVFSDYDFADIGRRLQRRMLDGWHRLAATKERFHEALALRGHVARACDQFGTLLACADLLLNDELPAHDEVDFWATLCAPDRMAEISEATPDETACLNHILTSMVQSRGGDDREMLGTWIGRVVAEAIDPPAFADGTYDKTRERLIQYGLKLVNPVWHPEKRDAAGNVIRKAGWGAAQFDQRRPGYLAVANSHRALAELFKGTVWQGGVWKTALARTDGAIEPVKIAYGKMVKAWAVLVPLAAMLDESELPWVSRPANAAGWVAEQQKERA